MCILSYYHQGIRSMNHLPLSSVRSWNSGMYCMSFYIFRRCYTSHHFFAKQIDVSGNIQQNVSAASQGIYFSAKLKNPRPNKFTQVAQHRNCLFFFHVHQQTSNWSLNVCSLYGLTNLRMEHLIAFKFHILSYTDKGLITNKSHISNTDQYYWCYCLISRDGQFSRKLYSLKSCCKVIQKQGIRECTSL